MMTNHSMVRQPVWLALIGVVLLGLLVGCTAPAPPESEADSPVSVPTPNLHYSAEFAAAKAAATTDFERKVLDDDVITRAEFTEARNLYFRCIRARGLEVTTTPSESGLGGLSVTGSWEQSAVDSALSECLSGTTEVIEPLYVELVTNPDKRDLNDLIAECLVAFGVVQAPFTGADYIEQSQSGEFNLRIMDDPDGARCEQNPNAHNAAAP